MDRAALRGQPGRTALPAYLSPIEVPLAQTMSSLVRANAERQRKHKEISVDCGPPMKCNAPPSGAWGYFGAVWLRDGRFCISPGRGPVQWHHLLGFLRDLRRTSIKGGRRIVVITDNPKCHHSRLHQDWREQQAPGFALDFLTLYSASGIRLKESGNSLVGRCLHDRYFAQLKEVIVD